MEDIFQFFSETSAWWCLAKCHLSSLLLAINVYVVVSVHYFVLTFRHKDSKFLKSEMLLLNNLLP